MSALTRIQKTELIKALNSASEKPLGMISTTNVTVRVLIDKISKQYSIPKRSIESWNIEQMTDEMKAKLGDKKLDFMDIAKRILLVPDIQPSRTPPSTPPLPPRADSREASPVEEEKILSRTYSETYFLKMLEGFGKRAGVEFDKTALKSLYHEKGAENVLKNLRPYFCIVPLEETDEIKIVGSIFTKREIRSLSHVHLKAGLGEIKERFCNLLQEKGLDEKEALKLYNELNFVAPDYEKSAASFLSLLKVVHYENPSPMEPSIPRLLSDEEIDKL